MVALRRSLVRAPIVHACSIVALLAAGLVAPSDTAVAQRAPASDAVVLRGGTVIDVATGRHLADASVVVSRGKIVSVSPGTATNVPRGAKVIDTKGKFVIPGLWDMHVEQALPVWDRTPVDSNAALFFPLFLAYGVTGVRDVAGPTEVLGRWRRDIESGARLGPRIVFTGPKLGREAVGRGAPFPVKAAGDIAKSLEVLKRDGARSTYVLSIPEDMYPALADESRRLAVPFEGLVPIGTTLWEVSRLGQHAVDHLDGLLIASSAEEGGVRKAIRTNEEKPLWARVGWKLGLMEPLENPWAYALESWSESRATALFAHLARNRTWQIPTLRMLGGLNRAGDSALRLPPAPLELRPPKRPWNGWAGEPYADTHPASRVWAKLLWSVGAMQRAGVPLLAGSDTPNRYAAPGLSLHDELALFVRAGLTPLQALRTATLAPAEYLNGTDSLGAVRAGRAADLLVLDADPTIDIANTRRIFLVVARGRVLDRAALDGLLGAGTVKAREVEAYWIARQKATP